MKNEWDMIQADNDIIDQLIQSTGCSRTLAALLAGRGITSPESARSFLNPSLANLVPPFHLKDMERAVKRITDALEKKENILIFGDYDVDGVTATTILFNFLSYLEANVSFYIPHRVKEGYSFNSEHVEKVLVPAKTDLVITVDCGSDSHEAVTAASEKNIDVIITDHHTIPVIPEHAVAVVNPKREDCSSGIPQLAGVGVAFYLLMALRKHLRDIGFWGELKEPNLKAYCDLTALGTIGDVVPLVGINRIITKTGIDVINSSPGIGLKAMIRAGKINKKTIDSTDIAYKIAPRINAAGRIRHANIAVDLLCAKTAASANRTAVMLNELNHTRQEMEKAILDEIEAHISDNPAILDSNSIVLFKQGWHIGLLGIVASKLVNTYHRPVVLIALDGEDGKGSGRSVPGTNLFKMLADSSDTLEGYGGHAMAAGLAIKKDRLRSFKEKFSLAADRQLAEKELKKSIQIDSSLLFEEITPELLDDLEKLQPFGAGNPEPVFIMKDITIVSAAIVGGSHRRLVLQSKKSSNDSRVMAMHFNSVNSESYPNYFNFLVFKLQWNYWNNSKSIQIIVEDYL